jgi:pyruvate kinase
VRVLRERLVALGAGHLGLVLKGETRRGFEALPEILFAALAAPAAGIMIARGDLALERGRERLADVQEEILWDCARAHMPVVRATQVRETLARSGRPSRTGITDAAMGGRAECVCATRARTWSTPSTRWTTSCAARRRARPRSGRCCAR